MGDALATVTADRSEIAALEELAEQTGHKHYVRRPRSMFGWHASPNIERAFVSREQPAQVAAKPEVPAPVIDTFSTAEITSYTELMTGIRAQVTALGIRLLDFDDLAGFPAGLSGKIFGPSQVKRLGPEKLFDALRAAGLRLRIEIDPDQHAKMKARTAENFNPRCAAQARPNNNANPRIEHPSKKMIDEVLSYLAGRKGGRARLNDALKEARSNSARHAANVQWKQRRASGNALD
jgi:hypothetical protein